MQGALIILVLSLVYCGTTAAADPTCDTFPPDSLSRIECEKNLATARRAKEVEEQSAPRNLGIVPSAPASPFPTIDSDVFCWNANKYTGEEILLRRLRFKKLIGEGSATFTTPRGQEILITDLPANLNLTPYGLYSNFIVRGLGINQGTNAYGGPAPTPSASFIEVWK